MKKNIHPNYHSIKVEMTDGTQFETKSTWGYSVNRIIIHEFKNAKIMLKNYKYYFLFNNLNSS